MIDFQRRAQDFLAVSSQFRLGELPTEQPHPLTSNLSTLARDNVGAAVTVMRAVDANALNYLLSKKAAIEGLARHVEATLAGGHSIYLCGCGATGRLALSCEALWRRTHENDRLKDRVIGFMAGGDVALVRSIENFEDHPEYGARHLDRLGFADGDLYIGCTEGGETPFVIGATMRAAEVSSNPPYFLYCNPDEVLCKVAERSATVINDSRITKICCAIGPMALTGSTRMQATTVLMAVVGSALMLYADAKAIGDTLETLSARWNQLDCSFLESLIVKESSCYENGDKVLYAADGDLAIALLTDTTERAPTFGVEPFEKANDAVTLPSLCYLYLPNAQEVQSAWNLILNRAPRSFNWGAGLSLQPYDYDFSVNTEARRNISIGLGRQYCFSIINTKDEIVFNFDGTVHCLPVQGLPLFAVHLVLKMLLNIHSTLVMGRLGRYDGNLMTWVKPSNNKLIDRAIRYVDLLLKNQGIFLRYDQIALACFAMMEKEEISQSLVHRTVQSLTTSKTG